MPKLILKNLFLLILIAPVAFADEPLSTFNQQSDLDYPEPLGEENYFATATLQPPAGLYRYIGINGGMDINLLKVKLSNPTTTSSLNETPFSYNWGIYGGLCTSYKFFYIAAELSANYNTLSKKLSATSLNQTDEVLTKHSFGAAFDLIPGYLNEQRDFLFYGRFGVGTGLFKIRINDDPNSETRKFASGLRAGLGMEYFMSDSFSMRLEYVFNNYGNIKKTYQPTNSTVNNSYELSPLNTHQVNLGLTIRF